MRRTPAPPAVLLLLVLTLALAGCGGGDGRAGADDEPSASAPSESATTEAAEGTQQAGATYFVEADSDAVNAVVAAAQRSGAATTAPERMGRCGRMGEQQGYAAWRRCWHGLLDPFVRDLDAVAATLGRMAGRDLPAACTRELRAGQQRFTGSGKRVDGLLTGIDSDDRAAQERSMDTYRKVVGRVGEGFAPYFRALTRACYSPSDLESIDAAAKADPSASAEG
ncbi:hypothetical protein ASG49_06985 [Marmoricola sp. Leaf446]|uniref:hypothetical protein n=1 Tax=Marmoricola sp. Leaf446 TaxID=1736379 RepID=UPI0006FB7A27|nr:hypothetical protein [Marmoricola sp. Leaf446]KQT94590.1 hypothetical protein ASG49_06985 [Marmoricola sp. Leaf446]